MRFAAIIRQIGSYLGQGYVASSIVPAFIESLPLLNTNPGKVFIFMKPLKANFIMYFSIESFFDEESTNDRDAYTYSMSGLVPGYFLGCMAQNTVTCQADTLRQWSVMYCLSGFSTGE